MVRRDPGSFLAETESTGAGQHPASESPFAPDDVVTGEGAEGGKPNHYLRLRDLIISGSLIPNERLVEADLAVRLGTNRANVRIALGRLDQEGLVVSEPNHGARVRVVEPVEAIQIFETRGALECLVVEHAARRATVGDCQDMAALLDEMMEALRSENITAFSAATARLRSAIWAASRHDTATRLLRSLNYQLVRFRYQSITMPGRAAESLEHFSLVVGAIRAKCPSVAKAAMEVYTAGAVESLRKSFGNALAR